MYRKVYFFGGKGGVGKTTVSASFATLLSERGRRTLLISTDPAHSLSDVFGTSPSTEVREISSNLSILEIDPYAVLEEYIQTALKSIEPNVSSEVFGRIKEILHSVGETPGAEEAAVIDKLSTLVLENLETYASIVIDTAPTGHTLQMLKTVGRVGRWLEELLKNRRRAEGFRKASGGTGDDLSKLEDRRRRFSKFLDLLLSEKTLFVPVLNPEKLPILETERMVKELRKFGIRMDFLVVNKILPENVREPFFLERKMQEKSYLRDIEARFSSLRIIKLPLRERDPRGVEDLREIALELGRRLGL